ncbi:MAG: class I SAM-dependent methyltransferase [Thermoplasmatota archaeon]
MEKDTIYNEKYKSEKYYWGKEPSSSCFKVLELKPPVEKLKLLVVGCGEGKNAVFFARNGYDVTAFDLSEEGIKKTKRFAADVGIELEAFTADLNEFRCKENYDIIFSNGTLHYIPVNLRVEILDDYRDHTNPGGINVHSVFVDKPFIRPAPDIEETACKWISGELMTYYHDWKIEWFVEKIFDCDSSGIAHRHAMNRIAGRKLE